MKLKKLTTAAIILAGLACSASSFATPNATTNLNLSWTTTIAPKPSGQELSLQVLQDGNVVQNISTEFNLPALSSSNSDIATAPVSLEIKALKGLANNTFTSGTKISISASSIQAYGPGIVAPETMKSKLKLLVNGNPLTTSTPVEITPNTVGNTPVKISALFSQVTESDFQAGSVTFTSGLILTATLDNVS